MSHITRWDVDLPCPRESKEGEQCAGTVRCHGYYNPGRTYGDPYYCYPPESEENVDTCSACGTTEWSDSELATLAAQCNTTEEQSDDDPRE